MSMLPKPARVLGTGCKRPPGGREFWIFKKIWYVTYIFDIIYIYIHLVYNYPYMYIIYIYIYIYIYRESERETVLYSVLNIGRAEEGRSYD